MGTNCAPLLADLFLYSYEWEFLQKLVKDKKIHEARTFNFTYRYIDDVLSINNSRFFQNFFHWYILQSWKLKSPQIQLRLHHFWTYTSNLTTVVNSVLKFTINGTTSILKSYIFQICAAIYQLLLHNYGVYISQLVRYARASSNYSDFLKRHLHLWNRLLDQGY